MRRFFDTIFVASVGFGLGMAFHPFLLEIVKVPAPNTMFAAVIISGLGMVGMAATR